MPHGGRAFSQATKSAVPRFFSRVSRPKPRDKFLSPSMLIDSHAHIQGKEYAGEVEAVIDRAREAGVEKIVAVGGAGDMSSNTDAIALAKSFPNVYATVGMHPHDAKDVGESEVNRLRQLATAPKVVAIGETGLDYYYDHSPR